MSCSQQRDTPPSPASLLLVHQQMALRRAAGISLEPMAGLCERCRSCGSPVQSLTTGLVVVIAAGPVKCHSVLPSSGAQSPPAYLYWALRLHPTTASCWASRSRTWYSQVVRDDTLGLCL